MKIAFCAAEVAPFAKVGGLGDVVGSLPKALADLGEEVVVFVPYYGCLQSEQYPLVDADVTLSVTGPDIPPGPIRILVGNLPNSTVRVFLIDHPASFGQYTEVYPSLSPSEQAQHYRVFAEAVLQCLAQIGFSPNIFHVHDWHTAILPVLLKQAPDRFSHAKTVLTIHNLAYQGIVEDVNWLAQGIIHSDWVTTVSPTYAQEIMTAADGAGLDHLIREHQHKLEGILNGIDTDLLDPARDPFLPEPYTPQTVEAGKRSAKAAVQVAFGLPVQFDVPLFVMVTRLVEQKGLDLVLELLPKLYELPAQFAILGQGESRYEDALREANTASGNVRCRVEMNIALGQQMYAGSDFFLMPSRFEPCGLSQMIALRYGTVPVVRKTGGLADTVRDLHEGPDVGDGIVFETYSAIALQKALQRSLALWQHYPETWKHMVAVGMTQDFGWRRSALRYQERYRHLVGQDALPALQEA